MITMQILIRHLIHLTYKTSTENHSHFQQEINQRHHFHVQNINSKSTLSFSTRNKPETSFENYCQKYYFRVGQF